MAGILDLPGIGPYMAVRNQMQGENSERLRNAIGIMGLQGQMEDRAFNAQLMPLKIRQLESTLAAEAQKRGMLAEFAGRMGGGQQAASQGAMAEGAAVGDVGPTVTNAQRVPQAQAGGLGYSPQDLVPLKLAGHDTTDLLKIWEAMNPPAQVHGGYAFQPRQLQHGQPLPRMEVTPQGQAVQIGVGPGGPSVAPLPGSLDTFGQFQDITQRAQARYGAPVTMQPASGSGPAIMMRPDQASDFLGGAPVPPAPRAPAIATPTPANFPRVSPEQQRQRDTEAGRLIAAEGQPGGGGLIPSSRVLGPGMPVQSEAGKAANVTASTEFIKEMRDNYGKLRDSASTLTNIDAAKAAIPPASTFMGPLGEQKLQVAKFFRNALGINVDTAGVTGAEELRSRVFMQIMDNLKKMDAQPSTYQQRVMQDALGTLGTDPQSLPKVLDVFGDLIRSRVNTHNQTVDDALKGGTAFPYNVRIDIPQAGPGTAINDAVRGGAGAPRPTLTPNRGGNVVEFGSLRR